MVPAPAPALATYGAAAAAAAASAEATSTKTDVHAAGNAGNRVDGEFMASADDCLLSCNPDDFVGVLDIDDVDLFIGQNWSSILLASCICVTVCARVNKLAVSRED